MCMVTPSVMLIIGGNGKDNKARVNDGILLDINSNQAVAAIKGSNGFTTKFHSDLNEHHVDRTNRVFAPVIHAKSKELLLI